MHFQQKKKVRFQVTLVFQHLSQLKFNMSSDLNMPLVNADEDLL